MSTLRADTVLSPAPRPVGGRRIWEHRELLRSLVLRNLKVKYQRSALGFVWTLLNPLVTVAILAVVFSHVVRIPVPHYWAFLLSGYFVWNFVIQTLNTGTYVFAEHSRLIRSAAFPPELLVLGAAIAKLIEFAAAMALVLVAIAVFHHGAIPLSWILLPILVVAQLLMVTGLTFPVATSSAFYYDVQHALPIALTTLFYISPVFYPASMVPAAVRPLYLLNPVASLLTLFQQVVYEGQFPPLSLVGGTIAGAAVLYFIGYAFFNRFAAVYPEIV